ncbi:FecR family protein [Pedobacter sp. ok626]|uniref:FecR family protein n=1 Tax=Pedobacter sp. ok626 TaxID=1761882 RepID=UPI00088B7A9F|nr:FecR family protein [Pedobacter sp. ok626]SDL87358.1 FecR family protein [Pedobacter sp. ok626]
MIEEPNIYVVNRIADLINGYLFNDLNGAELEELTQWINATEENKQIFKSIVNEPALSYSGKIYNNANVVSALTNAKKELVFSGNKVVKLKSNRNLWSIITSAAAIIMVISAGIFFFDNSRFSGLEIVKGSTDIRPGAERATLTLSNGIEIDLTTLKDGELAIKQTGVKITKTREGEVIYNLIDERSVLPGATSYNTIKTPIGGKYRIILPDSTRVWLNASSSLTYPTSFSEDGPRRVELKGEGYFEVHKVIKGGAMALPFVVSTLKQEIRVLGTHFNVNAYSDEPLVATTLLEGMVKINDKVILKPGQQAISKGDLLNVKTVNAADYVDWKSGEFNLSNDDFRSIMRKISRWYDVEVIYDDSAPEQVKLGGWISRTKNISSILNIMQKTGKVHFKLEGRRVTVSK